MYPLAVATEVSFHLSSQQTFKSFINIVSKNKPCKQHTATVACKLYCEKQSVWILRTIKLDYHIFQATVIAPVLDHFIMEIQLGWLYL